MNEADTRAQLIDPKLAESGWGLVESSRVFREHRFTKGKILPGIGHSKPLVADYILEYKGRKLAVVEAKKTCLAVNEGVVQAKNYAEKLQLDTCFACNGKEIYQVCMQTGQEGLVDTFPTPEELWKKTFPVSNPWLDAFNKVPFKIAANKEMRYYQEIAVNNVMKAIAEEKQRILLTLATGTGKTFIAFQIVWKLFQTRWNLKRDGLRQPRILFLTDRNNLANQAFNAFSACSEDGFVDGLARINPKDIAKKGHVPTNAHIFFTIFQTFMSGKDGQSYFGQYAPDFFDFIIIDECHRGGAKDDGNWRAILEYFSSAVQLGLTATPKRQENVNTYKYFGSPVYVYSLKQGIDDGFLTPFIVKKVETTLDEYIYTSEDEILEGEVEEGKIYREADFNKNIEIEAREAKRVQLLLSSIKTDEKVIVFCVDQDHAMRVRDLINQQKAGKEPNYCVRVTSNDGMLGDEYLEAFRDNDRLIPTILTTSYKLSTGVDALNVRGIAIMRKVDSMIEFKQIIGRGTRLFEGKHFFTIFDFVGACHHFADPDWDGEPLIIDILEKPDTVTKVPELPSIPEKPDKPEGGEGEQKTRLKIKLGNGKEHEIEHMISTQYWAADGKLISTREILQKLFDGYTCFFESEEELRQLWSHPEKRSELLEKLAGSGYGIDELKIVQKILNAEGSDLFDVLAYVASHRTVMPITREARVAKAQFDIFSSLNNKYKEFLEFVLFKYIETGVEELDMNKLSQLLDLKYHSIEDAIQELGNVEGIKLVFINFQKYLYQEK